MNNRKKKGIREIYKIYVRRREQPKNNEINHKRKYENEEKKEIGLCKVVFYSFTAS